MPTSLETISSTESREYTITRLSKQNLKDLAILHSEVYGTPVKEEFFLKKYDTAYTGLENAGYIAYNKEEKPVAYYGVIPCFIHYKNEVMLAAQSADTMTHPKHRYKGMFVELSNKAFDLCKELGIRLVFGFPNQNSYHGAVNKLGWKMTEAMDCFIIPVKGFPLEPVSKKIKLVKKIYDVYARSVLKNKLLPLQGVNNSVTADGFAGIHRNDEYFSYKTYNPSKIIKIDAVKLWISNKPGMLIGDIEGINETNFKQIIIKLKRIAKKLGIRQVQFHCSPGTNLHQLFSGSFDPVPSYPVLFQDFGSPVPPEKIKFTFADIDIF